MVRSLVVAWREVWVYLHDRGDLAFTLVLPMAIFALMYGAFGGENLFHGTAYIVNQDPGGAYSTVLLDRLGKLSELEVSLISATEAEDKLQRADLQLVAFIPPDFSTDMAAGKQANVVFRQRGNGGQEGQIVASIIRSKTEALAQEAALKRQVRTASGGSQQHTAEIVDRFVELAAAGREREVAEVRSAIELDDAQVARLAENVTAPGSQEPMF